MPVEQFSFAKRPEGRPPLSPTLVKAIIDRYIMGYGYALIAKTFGVNIATVYKYVKQAGIARTHQQAIDLRKQRNSLVKQAGDARKQRNSLRTGP